MSDRPTAEEIETLAAHRAAYTNAASRLLLRTMRYLKANEPDDACRAILQSMPASVITPEAIAYARDAGIELTALASFRQSLAVRHRAHAIHGSAPEWMLEDKALSFDFADRVGIVRPRILATGVPLRSLDRSRLRNAVLKPLKGSSSHYVCLVRTPREVFDVSRGKDTTLPEAFGRLSKAVDAGKVADAWRVEELVTEDLNGTPGRDLKFYCFYGRCAFVLEVVRRKPPLYCFFDRAGSIIDTGKYPDRLFDGAGATASQFQLAEHVSHELPVPFMRIDFIKSASAPSGLCFGEFTPSPGGFDRFNPQTDVMLGEYWLDAQLRLDRDLLAGRRFRAFNAVYAAASYRSRLATITKAWRNAVRGRAWTAR